MALKLLDAMDGYQLRVAESELAGCAELEALDRLFEMLDFTILRKYLKNLQKSLSARG